MFVGVAVSAAKNRAGEVVQSTVLNSVSGATKEEVAADLLVVVQNYNRKRTHNYPNEGLTTETQLLIGELTDEVTPPLPVITPIITTIKKG